MGEYVLLVGEDGIVVSLKDDFVPCSAEDEVGHRYFILKSGSKGSLPALPECLLDLSPDSRNGANLRPDVAGNFDGGIEHALDECSVLHDLEGLANQLDLLHYLSEGEATSKDLFISSTTPEPAMRNFLRSFLRVCRKTHPEFCRLKLP